MKNFRILFFLLGIFAANHLSANVDICGTSGQRAAEYENKGDYTTAVLQQCTKLARRPRA